MATTARAPAALLDRAQAVRWRESWAQVMGGFVPHLASLEETLCSVAEAVRGRAPTRVLDLGGGPGLLAERMARRWTDAAITLMDIDPVLLALARGALAGEVRTLEGDLSTPRWVDRAGGGYDLVTVVMTLHYLPPAQVRAFYADARRCLALGGLLIVADLMPDEGLPSLMGALNPAPGEAVAELAWARWWNDIAEMDLLRPLLAQRAAIFENRLPAEFTAPGSWHTTAAREAGFGEAGILWRCGRHAALAAMA
ncbi:class I SAM-dependent methyltransferase [Micromonospora sp. PSH03]|uniref:class I SAM-dependent methyltransferase n=1 Tax=Micromonospora TaxID=1873 RepID=UPI001B360A21|nr:MULTISPECIES: class I SAM-dependent methyltransferase [Micromonospora]MBQ0988594.1 class I SAM-dependent methyltransferase [Micromonospora sp. H61]MCG5454859.1 class I SAM-dependent methyltransferase [Micromonospora salmantinae]